MMTKEDIIRMAQEPVRRQAVNNIRVRIMQEAYDLADRDDSEGYNAVKVMCSDVLAMINKLLDERQPEQEPVAWMNPSWIDPDTRGWASDSFESIPIEGWIPLYAAPRRWQGLTAAEIWKCNAAPPGSEVAYYICGAHQYVLGFAEAIEAKLKEKNNG